MGGREERAETCWLPPAPASVPRARRHTAAVLAGMDGEVVATAELLTSELVTNAVLHARTPVELSVRVEASRVKVRVFDGEPGRAPIRRRHLPEGATGRGLELVEALASDFGVQISEVGKVVWFELRTGSDDDARPQGWDVPDGPPGRLPVHLAEVPVGLCRASQQHRAALLREAHLAVLSGAAGVEVGPDELADSSAINAAFDAGLNAALAEAGEAGGGRVALDVCVPAALALRAEKLAGTLATLDGAARSGLLLTRPALPELRRFRQWLLGEAARQARGQAPGAWRFSAHEVDQGEPGPGLSWDAGGVEARRVPAVAAGDDNRILAVNAAAAALLGWDADDLAGRRITALIPPEWRERHVAGFTSFLLTGRSNIIGSEIEVRALHRDGSEVPVALALTVEQTVEGRTVFIAELRPLPEGP